ncbi:hypothetical protein HOA92_00850 [archaeon]|nr:hypothetical protein [archaeon]MBT6761566.1 hypothetical protein [archaeon]
MKNTYLGKLENQLGRRLRQEEQERLRECLDQVVLEEDVQIVKDKKRGELTNNVNSLFAAAVEMGLSRNGIEQVYQRFNDGVVESSHVGTRQQASSTKPLLLIAGAAATLLIGFGVATSGTETTVTTATPIVENVRSPIEAAPQVDATALDQFKSFERIQRDQLYDTLLTQTGEASLLSVLDNLPTTLAFIDKFNPNQKFRVGPRDYLFVSRPVNHTNPRVSIFENPDSFSLDISVTGSDTPLRKYKDALRDSSSGLGLYENPLVQQLRGVEMAPFYESIRNPTEGDLIKLHKMLDDSVPDFVVEAFLQGAIEADIKTARRIIESDPMHYSSVFQRDKYWGTERDLSENGEILQPVRYENGELTYSKDGGIHVRGGMVLPKKWEKESLLSKWLYRRGPSFIDNFEVMLDVYPGTETPKEFAGEVLKRLDPEYRSN